jgi:hypothetical protein
MTIAGFYTAHETDDLLRAKVSNVADLAANVARVGTPSDPAWPAWLSDYQAFRAGWDPVAADVGTWTQGAKDSLVGWDITTDLNQDWNALLAAIAPLSGLIGRWKFGTYASNPTPQPTAGDTDIGVLNTINALPVVGANSKASTTTKFLLWGAGLGLVGAFLLRRAL